MCANAFAVGVNSAGNTWGVAVGSGAISIRQAVWISGVMEVLGATTLGERIPRRIYSYVFLCSSLYAVIVYMV